MAVDYGIELLTIELFYILHIELLCNIMNIELSVGFVFTFVVF